MLELLTAYINAMHFIGHAEADKIVEEFCLWGDTPELHNIHESKHQLATEKLRHATESYLLLRNGFQTPAQSSDTLRGFAYRSCRTPQRT